MSRRHRTHRTGILALALALAAPAALAAQGIPANAPPLRTSLADLATLRATYVDAFNKKDAAAVTALYADDAVVILEDGQMLNGGLEIGARMAAEAPNWPHAVAESDTTRVYGSTAVDLGTWTVHPADGGEMKFRYVTMLRRGLNGWKITHVSLVPMNE
jgi:uncharacterized protein (TIGR02246 family)